jgi:hypothetical protein
MKVDKQKVLNKCNLNTQVKNKLKALDKILKQYKIPRSAIILFGSVNLGIRKLRCMNDLDCSISEKYFKRIQQKIGDTNCKVGSYCAEINIGEISFIHEKATPKIKDKYLSEIEDESYFDFIDGFKVINKKTWETMQKQDPDKKDKKFLEKK